MTALRVAALAGLVAAATAGWAIGLAVFARTTDPCQENER